MRIYRNSFEMQTTRRRVLISMMGPFLIQIALLSACPRKNRFSASIAFSRQNSVCAIINTAKLTVINYVKIIFMYLHRNGHYNFRTTFSSVSLASAGQRVIGSIRRGLQYYLLRRLARVLHRASRARDCATCRQRPRTHEYRIYVGRLEVRRVH